MLSNIGVYLQFIRVDVAEETFLSILLEKKCIFAKWGDYCCGVLIDR